MDGGRESKPSDRASHARADRPMNGGQQMPSDRVAEGGCRWIGRPTESNQAVCIKGRPTVRMVLVFSPTSNLVRVVRSGIWLVITILWLLTYGRLKVIIEGGGRKENLFFLFGRN